jgi:hypothetical protein
MSGKYDQTKGNISGQYPSKVGLTNPGASGFTRVEAYLTPERLKQEWLFGIPLVHPYTKQQLTDETLKNIINKASSRAELECGVDIAPIQRAIRLDFDRTKYSAGFGQLDLNFKNVRSIEEMSIRAVNNDVTASPSAVDGTVLYTVPLQWIDTSRMDKGILHLIPLQGTLSTTGLGAIDGVGAGASALLYAVFSRVNFIPSFWYVLCTCGFAENSVPSIVNDLIGTYAAMEVLSMMGPLNKFNSQSLGVDGISQSTSNPGNQLYALRMQELQEKEQRLRDIIKSYFGNKITFTNW